MGTPRNRRKFHLESQDDDDSEEDRVNQDDDEEEDPSYLPDEKFSPSHSEKSYNSKENTSMRSFESSPHYLRSRTITSPISSSSSSSTSPENVLFSKLRSSPNTLYPEIKASKDVYTESNSSPKLYPILESKTSPSVIHNNDKNNCNKSVTEHALTGSKRNISENDKGIQHVNLVLICLVVLLIALLVYAIFPSDSDKVYSTSTPFKKYISDIDDLTSKLPNQKRRLWSTIKASVHHILNESHSNYPSVILMASHSHTFHIALCVAKVITEKFESANGNLPEASVVEIDLLKHLNAVEQKKKLDENLQAVFQSHKSVVINNLQMLSAEAALLLHAYCDNDNAPHKDIMIVLMYYTDARFFKLDPDMPNSVEHYLEEQWTKELHADKVSALMSRVANNIVVVNDEDASSVHSVCSNL